MTKFKDSPLARALRDGSAATNPTLAGSPAPDLAYANLRGADLRQTDLHKADLRGAYCHSSDLRGVDLSEARIEGASHMARVSGAYFPANVSADEIRLSLEIGTRIRCR